MNPNTSWKRLLLVALGLTAAPLTACRSSSSPWVNSPCQGEAIAVLGDTDTWMGFSAEQVIGLVASGDWAVSWDPAFDAPFDTLHTTVTRSDADVVVQRVSGFDCHSTGDYMNVPVSVDMASGDGTFSATLTGSAVAASFDPDHIVVGAVSYLVTDVSDSVQAEFDAAIDAEDPSVKQVEANIDQSWSAPVLGIDGYAESANGTTDMVLAIGTLSPAD